MESWGGVYVSACGYIQAQETVLKMVGVMLEFANPQMKISAAHNVVGVSVSEKINKKEALVERFSGFFWV